MTATTAITCRYCGVSHAEPQPHCLGCGGDLPPPEAIVVPRRKRREWVGAAIGVAVLVTVVVVLSNKLSGPQQVEIVGASGAQMPDFEPGSAEHRYLMSAHFSSAYVTMSPLRMMLLQFRQMEGRYPDDFSQVGVDKAELVDGEYVTGVDLLAEGVLRAHLEPGVFGDGAVIVLKPVDVMSGTRTRWLCSTTVPDGARAALTGNLDCPYDADAADQP